jgi:hypothetical protein
MLVVVARVIIQVLHMLVVMEVAALAPILLELVKREQPILVAAVGVVVLLNLVAPAVRVLSSCVTPMLIQSPTPAVVLRSPLQQMAAIKSPQSLPVPATFPSHKHYGTLRISKRK